MNIDCAKRVIALRTRRKVDPLIRKLSLALVLSALTAASLAACGSSSNSSSSSSTPTAPVTSTGASTGGGGGGGGGGATIKVAADPSGALKYTTDNLSTTAGSDTVDFENQSPVGHNVTIADSTGKVIGATDTITGSSTSTTVDLKPGTYSFYCTVDSHEAAGMKGTLTVK
jgi:plastocyanin